MVSGPLYFGCITECGHFLWSANGLRIRARVAGLKWMEQLDGVLPPQDGFEIEGEARLHHIHGWTVIAFWDRSVDSRPKSNSVFFVPGLQSFEAALAWAKQAFPSVFKRFSFEVRLLGSYLEQREQWNGS